MAQDKGFRNNQIKTRNKIEQDEHCDNADARRVKIVGNSGEENGPDNPVHVQLSDGSINVGTVNAELEVQLSHLDNDPNSGDIHDSVRIGDGENLLAINPDGSLSFSQSPSEIFYNEITSLAANTLTTIISYTVPVGNVGTLKQISASGGNIATYTVRKNGTIIDKKRTYFSGPFNVDFNFNNLTLNAGDIVLVEVVHGRPMVADFNANIQLSLGAI